MPFELIPFLPRWLVVGLLIGLAVSILLAGVFLVGTRMYPDEERTNRRTSGSERRTSGGERRISGGERRRREIGEYLSAIEETYVTDREIAGRHVEFYLPERDVAITFDAEAYFHIQGSESISTEAVLVEYEMPGVHLGSRLPFETPELEFAPEEPDAVRTAFAVLGVDSDAEPEAIRAAYREKVKAAHPDHGGDQESFRRLQEAYAIATEHATAARSSPSSF